MYRYSYVFKWCGYNVSIRTSIIGIVYYVLFMCVYYLWWYGQIFKDIALAGLNAFGTCSSSATIPISLKCATEKNWHSRRNYFVDSSFRDNYRYGCSFDFDVIDDHILCDCTWY